MICKAFFALAVVVVASRARGSEVVTKYETVKVAEGVIAFIAAEPKSPLVNSNCVAIIGDDSVVLVDPGQVPTLTRRMLAEIRAITDKPVRYVINTHWHWDHNLANFVVRDAFPSAAIISTPYTRQSLIEFTPGFLQFFEKAPRVIEVMKKRLAEAKTDVERANLADDLEGFEAGAPEIQSVKFVAPTQTIDRETTLYLGKREVRVFHPGRANTAGDLVVYVPDAKVLITGDIVVAPTPYATASYFTEWIDVLKKLSAMEAVAIVPGHGPLQRDPSYMRQLTALLQSVVDQVGAAVKDGASLEDTMKRVDLNEHRKRFAGDDRRRQRFFDEYFAQSAVKTAWKQARGEKTVESPF